MTTQQQAWDAEAALREQDPSSSTETPQTQGTESTTAPAVTEKTETPAAAPAAAPAAPDPLEALRADFLAFQQSQNDLLQRFARTEQVTQAAVGRVAAWQSEQDAARKAAAEKAATGGPSRSDIAAANTPEKWNELKGQFPEWGDAIETFVDSRLRALTPAPTGITPEQLDERLKSLAPQASPDIDMEVRKDLVETVIPGWQQKVKSPSFGAWYDAQPDTVKALGSSVRVSDAVKLIRQFDEFEKTSAQRIEQDRQQALQIAASGGGRPRSQTSVDSGGQLSPEQIWQQEADARSKRRS